MHVSIEKINGGTQQFADTITNTAPLVVEVGELRQRFSRAVEQDDLPAPVAEAVDAEIDEVEKEATTARPRRGRMTEILARIGLLTSGVTAATDLTEAVEAAVKTISSMQ